jgi:hypothetical protein
MQKPDSEVGRMKENKVTEKFKKSREYGVGSKE